MKLATAVLSLSALMPVCAGQEPAAKLAAQTRGSFVMEAGETKLTDLIDRCAVHLGWNILTTPQEMGAGPGGAPTVQLQNKITTDRPGCEELLTSMLYRSGFALTTLDASKNLYEVINLQGPRNREVPMRATQRDPAQVLERPNLKVWVTVAMPLEHINATVATNALRPFFASTGASQSSLTIGNVGSASALLISGMQDQVAAAIQLVKTCDIAPPEERTGPQLGERIEAIERRLDALEKKLAGKAQDR